MRIKSKYLLLVALLCAGLTTLARAGTVDLGEHELDNSGEGTELQAFIDLSGHTDATLCFKSDQDNPDFTGSITFSVNDDNTLHVEWTLTGDQVICGFLTKDGSGTLAHLYSVDADQGHSGEADLEVPGNGASALSHLTAFCCPAGVTTPDSGTTAMLLGGALAGLGAVRRHLRRN
jgi:VPDSG-CTERM motif